MVTTKAASEHQEEQRDGDGKLDQLVVPSQLFLERVILTLTVLKWLEHPSMTSTNNSSCDKCGGTLARAATMTIVLVAEVVQLWQPCLPGVLVEVGVLVG